MEAGGESPATVTTEKNEKPNVSNVLASIVDAASVPILSAGIAALFLGCGILYIDVHDLKRDRVLSNSRIVSLEEFKERGDRWTEIDGAETRRLLEKVKQEHSKRLKPLEEFKERGYRWTKRDGAETIRRVERVEREHTALLRDFLELQRLLDAHIAWGKQWTENAKLRFQWLEKDLDGQGAKKRKD